MQIKRTIYCLLAVFFATGNSQAQFELNYFFANQQNQNIELSWEVKQGSVCNGMQIERSSDSVNYMFIGEVEGICGSGAVAQKFEFTDTSPIPFKKNYYRLVAGSGESFYQSLFYSYVAGSFFMAPNPITLSDMVYFEPNQTFIVTFYEISGQVIQTTSVSQTSVILGDILSEIPNAPFLLHVRAQNGNYKTKKLIGVK